MKKQDINKYAVIFVCAVISLHTLLIVVAPFPKTIIYEHIPKPFIMYLNQIGLNVPWNMFAPDPVGQQKIQLFYYKNKTDLEPTEVIEEPQNHSLYRMSDHRRFYMYNYFIHLENRIYKELGPLLCKKKNQIGQWKLVVWSGLMSQLAIVDERVMDCE